MLGRIGAGTDMTEDLVVAAAAGATTTACYGVTAGRGPAMLPTPFEGGTE